MEKMFIFTAMVLLAVPVKAEDLSLPGLPGMNTDAAPAEESVQLQRPDAENILADLRGELRLSSKQEERIAAAINKKSKDFDRLMKDYDRNSVEEKKWLYKMNESRHGMVKINKEMPDLVRDFLDDDQRQTYDSMLENIRKSRAAALEAKQAALAVIPEIKQEPVPTEPAVDAPKPLKKRKLVRKRKLRTGARTGANPPTAPAAPAAVAPEDEPGMTMVDKDPSAGDQAVAAPRKKRSLKRKVSAPKPRTVAAAVEPAGSKPTGKELPVEEDAGSYPP
ncbi:MAG: hypothetical protein A2270_06340 [Elusimicrobia bacterium RIFOXYA12_FULL_51_18]|nr:MAG: hypothetical protein A2270_06340 [Elusimicrobia bacterium RIFOXYA12_FULL_51_18]OGS29820.1 MAG: hypothetical protein A2218_03410 [Elusimicrobia bacterium RIFOXYA2_FULL_53_38]